MFVGWIRDGFKESIEELSRQIVCDKHAILETYAHNKSICFGVYDKDKLCGFVSAYENKNSFTINNFCYTRELEQIYKIRLIELLLKNISRKNKPIVSMVSQSEQDIFIEAGFLEHSLFYQAINSGEAVAFNFSHATAQNISSRNHLLTFNQYEKKAFGEDISSYLQSILHRSSSLSFSTQSGYIHSYAFGGSYIKISPWIMNFESYSDAEKLLRGVLFHRGLKQIIAFIPAGIKEIVELYKSYKFELKASYWLMYYKEQPKINLEMIYAY
jgi:hypothetical protein